MAGFVSNTYKVITPSWSSYWGQSDSFDAKNRSSADLRQSPDSPAQRKGGALAAIKRWLCCGWTEANKVCQDYVKPSRWKQMIRKMKAGARKVTGTCSEGICLKSDPLIYETDSYERNFDPGKEYWQDYPNYRVSRSSTLSVTNNLEWDEVPFQTEKSAPVITSSPPWQRRAPVAPRPSQEISEHSLL